MCYYQTQRLQSRPRSSRCFFFFFLISITVFYIFGDLLPHHWILLCFLLFRANDVLPFNVESLERVILLLHFYWWHSCFCSSVLSSHLSQKQKTLWWRTKECGWTTVHVRVSQLHLMFGWLFCANEWLIRFVKTTTPTHAHTVFISLKALIKHFNRNTLFYAIHIHSVIWYIGKHFFCLAYMSICQSLLWQHLLYMAEKVNWNYRGHYTHANYELRKKN